jgi:hypothetical protein
MVETEDLPAGGRRRLMCPAQRFLQLLLDGKRKTAGVAVTWVNRAYAG